MKKQISTKPFKDKVGKLRFDLIPPEMNLAFAEVATFGIDKLKANGVENPERNWEVGLKLVADHGAAHDRHYNKWLRGIDSDEESGLNHLKHALWHLAAMVTQIERSRIDLDDRPSKTTIKITNKQCKELMKALKDSVFKEVDEDPLSITEAVKNLQSKEDGNINALIDSSKIGKWSAVCEKCHLYPDSYACTKNKCRCK